MPAKRRPLLVPERHALILEHLESHESASLATLVRLTGSSESTIRRDLQELAAAGRGWKRTHGGIVSDRMSSSTYEPPTQVAALLHTENKQRIGAAAAALAAPGQSVLFDSGTTVMEAAKAIVRRGIELSAITNDVAIAQVLATGRDIDVLVTGGQVRPNSNTLHGSPGESLLQTMCVDLLLLGAHALDAEGITESSLPIAEMKKRMLAAARRTVLLLDSSKFGQRSFVRIAGLAGIHAVVTDAEPDQDLQEALREAGVELMVVAAGS